jgi:neutral ceramidase
MKNHSMFWAALVAFILGAGGVAVRAEDKPVWKAGVARAVITSKTCLWLAGYGGERPPDGKLHDLWMKALALEGPNGMRVMLVASEKGQSGPSSVNAPRVARRGTC